MPPHGRSLRFIRSQGIHSIAHVSHKHATLPSVGHSMHPDYTTPVGIEWRTSVSLINCRKGLQHPLDLSQIIQMLLAGLRPCHGVHIRRSSMLAGLSGDLFGYSGTTSLITVVTCSRYTSGLFSPQWMIATLSRSL